jgi:hypothetical protein
MQIGRTPISTIDAGQVRAVMETLIPKYAKINAGRIIKTVAEALQKVYIAFLDKIIAIHVIEGL